MVLKSKQMKSYTSYLKPLVLTIVFIFSFSAQAQQAFRRGTLLLSISEGATWANYYTSDISGGKPKTVCSKRMDGIRDPLFFEYGITNRFGIGMSTGADIFKVNASDFYGLNVREDNKVTALTSEFTFEGDYHVFTSKKWDVSLYSSFGLFSVNIKGSENDFSYKYSANGGILRTGARARYYFYKRFGALAMVSAYKATASPKNGKGNTFGNTYATTIKGWALEFGLCYRIIK